MPTRLGATYIGEDGHRHTPVLLHRAILGSLERFIGILLEHYAGNLPLWLAPVQIVITTIASDADQYASEILDRMLNLGLRAKADLRNEKINYKVREHSVAKVPVIIAVGKREIDDQTVSVRRLGEGGQQIISLDEALEALVSESKSRHSLATA